MDNYKALQRNYDHQEEAEKVRKEDENVHEFLSNFEYDLNQITSDDMTWDDITKFLKEQLEKAENRDVK